jgi:hypothetical protein
MRIRGSLAKVFLIALTLALIPVSAISAQKITPGSTCKVLNQKVVYQYKTYTCIKSGKKLVWNKGVAIIKPTPSPAPTVTVTATPSPAPTVTVTATPSPTSIPIIKPISPPQMPATPRIDQFAYEQVYDDGIPVHWDTCKPVTWTYFNEDTSNNALSSIQKALQLLADASGLSFTYVSPGVASKPSFNIVDNNLEKTPVAQIQIFFANTSEVPVLDSSHYGWTRTFWNYQISNSGKKTKALFKVAYVMMQKSDNIINWFNKNDDLAYDGLTIGFLHELGHAVGIQHVSDSSQIMFSTRNSNYPRGYALGDKYALFNIGAAIPCGS